MTLRVTYRDSTLEHRSRLARLKTGLIYFLHSEGLMRCSRDMRKYAYRRNNMIRTFDLESRLNSDQTYFIWTTSDLSELVLGN